jgi:hypothetical protein
MTGGNRLAERTVENRRQCPTRVQGAHSLIAHWITPAVCLDRQRRNYHKCFSCEYRGMAAEASLPPALRGTPPRSAPVAVPVRKAKSKKATKAG